MMWFLKIRCEILDVKNISISNYPNSGVRTFSHWKINCSQLFQYIFHFGNHRRILGMSVNIYLYLPLAMCNRKHIQENLKNVKHNKLIYYHVIHKWKGYELEII